MFRSVIRAAVTLLVAVATFASQNSGSINVTSQGAPASGLDVFLFVNQGKQPVGTTGSQGRLPFDPSLLVGKLKGETVKRTCSERTELILVTEGESYQCEEEDDDGERCSCEPAGAWLFSNGSIALDLGSGSIATMAKNPVVLGAVGGGVVTAIVIAGGGDDASSTSGGSHFTTSSGGMTSSGGGTSTSTSMDPTAFNGTYQGSFVLVRDECNFFNPGFNGRVVVDASPNGSVTVQIIESITRTSMGTLTVRSDGSATAMTTGSGNIGSLAINFETMLDFRNGQVDVEETIRKPAGNNCAATYRATGLPRQ